MLVKLQYVAGIYDKFFQPQGTSSPSACFFWLFLHLFITFIAFVTALVRKHVFRYIPFCLCNSLHGSYPFQNKLKAVASKSKACLIAEDIQKGQDFRTTDTGQSLHLEEIPRAEHAERENDLPQLADDLSTSLDELNVPSFPEALAVHPHGDYNLVNSLLNLTKSPVSCVRLFQTCQNLHVDVEGRSVHVLRTYLAFLDWTEILSWEGTEGQ